jgi:hypothetical protein
MLTIHISRRSVFILILGVLLALPAASWASHQFVDVPDDNIFHDDIGWLADAEVTRGCNPPTNDQFCPDAYVTRSQMAAFMHRLAENQVVDAATAETAGDADTLDGVDSTGFVHNDELRLFSLLAETMQPVDSTIGYDNTEGSLHTTSVSTLWGNSTYIGQVDLPDGATIERVLGYGYDGTPAAEYRFAMFRYSVFDLPVWTQMTDWALSGFAWSGGALVTEAQVYPSHAEVNNMSYSYGIFVDLPPDANLSVLRFVVETS